MKKIIFVIFCYLTTIITGEDYSILKEEKMEDRYYYLNLDIKTEELPSCMLIHEISKKIIENKNGYKIYKIDYSAKNKKIEKYANTIGNQNIFISEIIEYSEKEKIERFINKDFSETGFDLYNFLKKKNEYSISFFSNNLIVLNKDKNTKMRINYFAGKALDIYITSKLENIIYILDDFVKFSDDVLKKDIETIKKILKNNEETKILKTLKGEIVLKKLDDNTIEINIYNKEYEKYTKTNFFNIVDIDLKLFHNEIKKIYVEIKEKTKILPQETKFMLKILSENNKIILDKKLDRIDDENSIELEKGMYTIKLISLPAEEQNSLNVKNILGENGEKISGYDVAYNSSNEKVIYKEKIFTLLDQEENFFKSEDFDKNRKKNIEKILKENKKGKMFYIAENTIFINLPKMIKFYHLKNNKKKEKTIVELNEIFIGLAYYVAGNNLKIKYIL